MRSQVPHKEFSQENLKIIRQGWNVNVDKVITRMLSASDYGMTTVCVQDINDFMYYMEIIATILS